MTTSPPERTRFAEPTPSAVTANPAAEPVVVSPPPAPPEQLDQPTAPAAAAQLDTQALPAGVQPVDQHTPPGPTDPAVVSEQPSATPRPEVNPAAAPDPTVDRVDTDRVATRRVATGRVDTDRVDTDRAVVPARRRSRLVPVLAGLAAVLLALTVLLAVLVVRSSGAGPVASSRADALAAARAQSRVVFSYDYRHLAKDFAAGKAATTGAFRDEYVRTTGKLVTDVAPRYKAVVVADVSDAAVVSASESTVIALVFVNQQSSSTLVPTPKVTQSRLEMTLVHRGGQWLVAKVRAL